MFMFVSFVYQKWVLISFYRVFTNGPGDRGLVPGRVIPKTQKMVLNAAYKARIKGKVEQSRKRSSALPNALL